jgi:putative tryptophan/tyrosine transport system substrate-binding protein
MEALAQTAPRERQIYLVASDDSGPYRETLSGISAALQGRVAPPALLVERDRDAISKLLAGNGRAPDTAVFVAVGTRAAQMITKAPDPTVTCMVPEASRAPASSRQHAVVLTHPYELQLSWIRRIMPGARRLLVIYNPEENATRVAQATAAATRSGFSLTLRPAVNPSQLPAILESSGDAADAIWALPDAALLNQNTARAVLLFSYRNRMPMFAPSDNWVAAGALFALGWNFEDLGRQCGELAVQLALGRSPVPAATPPRIAPYTLNRRALEQFKLNLPESIVKGASRIHE